MRARLTALLTAVLVAVLWASPESVAYLCSMDGERRATCCCAPDGEHAERSHAEVERRDCCEVERSSANVSLAVAPAMDDDGAKVASVGAAQTAELAGCSPATDFVPTLPRGPPKAIGPPPYLRNCRFLI